MPHRSRYFAGLSVLAIALMGLRPRVTVHSRPRLTLSPWTGSFEHIKVLASDDFEGRGPGTAGEEKTVAYLTDQFAGWG